MSVPLLDLHAADAECEQEILTAVAEVIRRREFILGREVHALEAWFADYCAARHAVGVSSGTAALYLSLLAAGVKPGDRVVTSPFTFTATGEVILRVGAVPVFVDVDAQTRTMDPQAVAAAFSSYPRITAVMPVHLYGMPCDMDPITAVARRYNARVIEDAAQAHGARYRDRRVGSLGDCACFSFYPTKNLGGYGDGGMVVCSDDAIAQEIAQLRNHGRVQHYLHEKIGYNERLDNLQAAVLLVKSSRLDAWNERRRRIAAWYCDALQGVGDLQLPETPVWAEPVYHLFVVRSQRRDPLMAHLKQRGIGCAVQYAVPLHRQPAYRERCIAAGPLGVVERLCAEVLSLPMHPAMTESHVGLVADAVRSFFA